MADEKHIIKKAIVEIHVPNAQDASELQNKALSFFKEEICPMIERIVEKYSVEGETIRIDKLELDIKDFRRPEEYTFVKLQELEKQIEKKLASLISENRNNDFSGEIVTEVKKIPKEKADLELFVELLKTGCLPWWAKTEAAVSLEAIAQKVLQQDTGSVKKELEKVIAGLSVRKRIAYNLSRDTTEKIIALVCSRPVELLAYIKEFLDLTEERIATVNNLRSFIYEFVLKYPASAGSDLLLFIAGLVREKNDLAFAGEMYRISEDIIIADSSASEIKTALAVKQALASSDEYFPGEIRKIFSQKDRIEFFKEEDLAGKKIDPAINDNEVTDRKRPGNLSPEDEFYDGIFESSQAGDYFIKNSGVIILAPYLSALFKELGLYDGKAFVSDEAKERAAFLLQYLATGSEVAEEHEMVLNKIICGIPVDVPLTLQFSITDKEKEECLGLLQAVADNWTALKGTSGEGVRDAFFMRDGILEQQSNGWNLKIERTSIDVLLDKLPWGISILQMPWSQEMIFVTW